MRKLTHGSTFSGIGAPEIAAEMLGWENVFHCEINPFGREVLDYYFKNAKSYEDITKADFSEWRGRIDILTGGFPCQPFSYAGKRKGSEDDRYLWPYMLKCIEQVRPSWFIGENVAGIGTMVFPGEEIEVGGNADLFSPGNIYRTEERFVLHEIIRNLESAGYSVQPFVIPACAIGAPHRRDRVFIIAHNNAANTDRCHNAAGVPGKNEGEGREERIFQWDSLQQLEQPIDVRSKARGADADSSSKRLEGQDKSPCGEGGERLHLRGDSAGCGGQDMQGHNSQDTLCSGCMDGQHDQQGCQRNEWDSCPGCDERICGEERIEMRTSPDSSCGGGGTQGEGGSLEGQRCNRYAFQGERGQQTKRTDGLFEIQRDAAHTEGEQGDRLRPEQPQTCQPQSCQPGGRDIKDAGAGSTITHTDCMGLEGRDHHAILCDKRDDRQSAESDFKEDLWDRERLGYLLPENRWRAFPTQSPIYRGNDGIPFDVDSLAIPFSRWKKESLKAYGNAIVVQVMYEIFRAIDIIENQQNK